MFLEVALAKLLRENAAVAAIVADRIIPLVLDSQVTYPAVVYREIHGGGHTESLEGSSGLRFSRFAFYATQSKGRTSYRTVLELAEAVRLALQGFTGDVQDGSSPPETVHIHNISAGIHEDRYDDPTQTYQRVQIFDVWSTEAIPNFD